MPYFRKENLLISFKKVIYNAWKCHRGCLVYSMHFFFFNYFLIGSINILFSVIIYNVVQLKILPQENEGNSQSAMHEYKILNCRYDNMLNRYDLTNQISMII